MQPKPFLILVLAVIAILLLPARHSAQQLPPPAPPTQSTPPAASNPDASQAPPTGQTPTVIQSRVNLVDILFTVLNRRNKLVPDLEKADFKIFDDRVPQEIRYFSKQTELPLRIGMLLDTSNSIRDRLKFEQDASTNFLFSVLRHNKDEAFLMTFDDEPQVIQKFTGDAGALRDEIFKTRAGGGTAIYDAIYSACLNELSHPPRPPGDQPDVVRRVMILISDGDDNLSTRTRAEAIEMAQRASVVIYTISTSTQWIALSQTDPSKAANRKNHLTPGDQILQDLAEETGGRAFFPYHVDDLDQSFQDIGDELRNEYSIAYSPTNYVMDGRYHKIRIETPDHKGYQVNARRGYFARAGANSAGPGTPPAGSPR
ncbi:MAG TPA: VWA domain-containing protein [Verrucomicrobiae bacterium]|jgi:Ca-activated chloride channel family protein|nr:VWA domain-containing protein [Verrucomicrobiae bacterium]